MTFKFFFRRCKSSLIPCQVFFHVTHLIFEKRIIISPFAEAYQCTNFISIVFLPNFVSSFI